MICASLPAPSGGPRAWARERWVERGPSCPLCLPPLHLQLLLPASYYSLPQPLTCPPRCLVIRLCLLNHGSGSAHLDATSHRFSCEDCRDRKHNIPPCLSCLFTSLAINNQGDLHLTTWLFIAPHRSTGRQAWSWRSHALG